MLKKLSKNSSKTAILSGFLAILILLAMLMATAIFSISSNRSMLTNVVKENQQIAYINTMQQATRNRALMLYRMMTVKDPFARDDIYIQFKNEAQKFIKALQHLLDDKNAVAQQKIWLKIKPQVVQGSVVQNETVEHILSEDYVIAYQLLLNKVIPIQDKVAIALEKMIATQNAKIKNKLIDAQNINNQFYLYVVFLGGMALLFSLAITFYVYRYNTKTESTLILQQELAETANKAKSAFLANMSHEIRTPLTAIIGFSEQILNKNMSYEEQKKLKQTIVRNSKHLQNLINDILDLSKIESGQLEVEITATSPIQINHEIESIISKQAQDKKLSFTVNNIFPLPSSIISDPIRIKQILLNLCSNAIKFTQQGTIELNTVFYSGKNLISFIVTDTGIGLTKTEQKKIFKPFTQADVSTTRKYGGTGLGLSISHLLATELGGNLICESKIDKGSKFILTLPTGIAGKIKMLTTNEIHIPEPDNSFDNIDIKQLQGNILLAEDVIANQELISMYVKQTGAYLEIVCNGEEAIDKALEKEYDLILMDMQMPKVDGIEAISILRDKGYTKPIVTLTANAMSADKEKCLNAGANKFLAKPINVNAFYKVLNTYLKKQSQTPITKVGDSTITPSLEKLIQRFISELPSNISQINDAYSKKSWDQIQHISHYLKGIGSSFGFPEITKSATQLNNAILEKNYGATADLIETLESICNEIIASHKT
jgi:signal transduction histidine kinase/CheY-like chemotaxis protein/HPt (histidine-containing phosphotransfer) domain-containing protein